MCTLFAGEHHVVTPGNAAGRHHRGVWWRRRRRAPPIKHTRAHYNNICAYMFLVIRRVRRVAFAYTSCYVLHVMRGTRGVRVYRVLASLHHHRLYSKGDAIYRSTRNVCPRAYNNVSLTCCPAKRNNVRPPWASPRLLAAG